MKIKYKVFLVSYVLFLFSCGKISHEKFDTNKWRTSNLNSEENLNLRWNMINDLRNNYDLIGKTKSQIIILLGKPDTETKDELSYYLGYTGKGINTGTLTLTFVDYKVKKINIWQG